MDAVLLVIAAALIAGAWIFQVRRYPLRPCRFCDGLGRDRANNLTSGYQLCRRCNGTGHALRPAARLLGITGPPPPPEPPQRFGRKPGK